jgi:hypothetical protein
VAVVGVVTPSLLALRRDVQLTSFLSPPLNSCLRSRLGLGMRCASRPSSSVKWCVIVLSLHPLSLCFGMHHHRRLHMRLTTSYRRLTDKLFFTYLCAQNDAFSETSGILGGTFRRMNNMAQRQGCRWLWYIIFIILVFWFFVIVWWFRR